jgi:hypothetical protein
MTHYKCHTLIYAAGNVDNQEMMIFPWNSLKKFVIA